MYRDDFWSADSVLISLTCPVYVGHADSRMDVRCGQANMGFKAGGLGKVTIEYAVAAVGRGQ